MIKLLLAGASAIQVASTVYINGVGQINKMLSELESWMSENDYLNIDQFKGKLSQKNLKNPAEFERVQFMKYFSDRAVD